ncbi:MAG: pyridoxine 5'-phosphate synthase [Alphaproteobacteria bacterium]|nr:pyridoxine 5'-phosphate synthase [Alphaproteobacteria bacterium]
MADVIRLGINIDHVATLRNARGGEHPCPVRAALMAMEAGADGITAHLREDRRHIRDRDIERLKNEVPLPLNMEMAATGEMLEIALKIYPNAVCIVPEKRTELTTEGGLDVCAQEHTLTPYIKPLQGKGIRVSLFIDADAGQIEAAARTGADIVELHTGAYAQEDKSKDEDYLSPAACHLRSAAQLAHSLGLEVHAGHGLNYENVAAIAAIPEIAELNIGHFLMGEAMFIGMKESVARMRFLIEGARSSFAKATEEI